MIQKSYDDTPSLYLIPTPIGNLDDITVRSLNTLKTVDVVLCEDTRDTGLLLSHYDIKKKLTSCHEFNESKMIDYVVSRLKEGYNLEDIIPSLPSDWQSYCYLRGIDFK